MVWQRLAGLAQRRGKTLSETIVQLIEDAENKEKYANKMSSLKQDLQALLGKGTTDESQFNLLKAKKTPQQRGFSTRRELKPAAELQRL
ncbi:hypothetical protein ACLK15_05565 [Escherichia coli]